MSILTERWNKRSPLRNSLTIIAILLLIVPFTRIAALAWVIGDTINLMGVLDFKGKQRKNGDTDERSDNADTHSGT